MKLKIDIAVTKPSQPLISEGGGIGIAAWGISLLKSDIILINIHDHEKNKIRISKGMKDVFPKS